MRNIWMFLVLASACHHAGRAEPATKRQAVTVAQPKLETVTEWGEHTGRTEAVDRVELRARVGGYLQRVAFKEGDLVKKGSVLFVIDQRPYDAAFARATAELEQARAQAELAKLDAGRADALLRANAIPQREADAQRSNYVQLSARAKMAEAAKLEASLNREYATVRAPVSGRIGRMLVTPGNLVSASSPLANLVSINPLHVYVDVEEFAAHGLRAGVAATVNVDGADHTAVVDFIDNRVDPTTGTVKVRAVITNPDGRLLPGAFARVKLPHEGAHQAVLISDGAIGTDQDRKFVYVVNAENKAAYRAVKLGAMHDGLREIREGLAANDRVVVRGIQHVHPGEEVEAKP